MAVNEKTYVEKAIQTLQVDKPVPNPSLYHDQDFRPNHDDEKTSAAIHTDEESTPVDAAYSYSESLCLSQSPDSASSNQPKPYRAPKPAQLPRNRPNRVKNQGKRVVSLPESAQLKSSSDNLRIPADDGPSLRVVSLPGPELRNNPSMRSPSSTQDDLSSTVEYLDSSLDTSYRSGTGSMHPDSRGFPPSDMPMTPSPPSSPESVLVVGNESRVSKTFLRQCNMSSGKTCDAEDEAGWITWASSPPRPIPALHGPLSLPYARGAEGTIIEDADLPRMIWGLELEDSQSNAVYEAKSQQLDTAILGLQVSGPPNQVHYDSTRNATYQRLKHTLVPVQPQPFGLVPEFRPQQTHDVRAWGDAPIDIHKLTPYVRSVDPLQPKRISESMPPAFISVPPRQTSSPSMTPRIFVEPRPGSQITPGPRLSAIEIAQRYRAERQQTALPSLQSSSPSWSPTAPLDSPALPPFSLESTFPQPQHEHEFATNFNPSTFPRRDLPATKVAHRELQNIVNLPNANYPDPSLSTRMNTPASPQDSDSFARPASAIDMSLILKRLPPRAGSRSQDSPTLLQQQQPNAPRTRLLQGPRIQSIPMTRLIQRRLSSVAEELEDSACATSSPRTHVPSVRVDKNNDAPAGGDTIKAHIVETGDQGGGVEHGNKENATDSVKGTEKATIKKKWRSRKKISVRSLSSK
ncbi:hypothetical protein C0993_006898 [Termitomyces sp. T159_Od127]|nr:hypothetical protein C0993_006898 [Termitomyces sp. T159_Od127]